MSDASAVATLGALRAAYARGDVPRDEYWQRAAECYRRLREHTPLDAGGEVRAIHENGDGLVLTLRNGLRMAWDIDDVRTAPNVLLNHGVYERVELAVLSAIADHSSSIVDAGANVGWYTLHFAHSVAPRGGRVVAFEPVPWSFAMLQRNVALNHLEGATTLVPAGLADQSGDATFFVPERSGSVAASQRMLFDQEPNVRITASLVRLDDALADVGVHGLDLLKGDVEGGELPLLRGGLDSIRRWRPVLFLELLRKWSREFGYHPNDVITLLAGLGYACHAIQSGGLEPMDRMADDCPSTNFLFVQPQHASLLESARRQLRQVA